MEGHAEMDVIKMFLCENSDYGDTHDDTAFDSLVSLSSTLTCFTSFSVAFMLSVSRVLISLLSVLAEALCPVTLFSIVSGLQTGDVKECQPASIQLFLSYWYSGHRGFLSVCCTCQGGL